MTSNLHPTIVQALAPWTPRTEEEEARWIAADLEAMRRKVQDPFRQAEADAAQRREADFDQMQRSYRS
jgi:hypothetical protein